MSRWIRSLGALFLIGACTEHYKPDVSTETGNPPAIDASKIALVVTRDEVHVRGEAGAVSPPEAEVEITIVRTQDLITSDVEDDGSFDVEVDATLNDLFEVRAVLDGQRSGAVIVDRGGAMVAGGDGGAGGLGDGGVLSCEERGAIVDSMTRALIESADKSCTEDADCAPVGTSSSCTGGCGYEAVSAGEAAAIRRAHAEANETWCIEGFESCPIPAVDCAESVVRCEAGTCVSGRAPDCDVCLGDDVSWHISGVGSLPALIGNERHTLTDCDRYTFTLPDSGSSCSRFVSRCAGANGGTTIEDVLAALAEPAIQTALAEGGAHGAPEDNSEYVYELAVGDRAVTYRQCGPLLTPCDAIPAFEALIELLNQLALENLCYVTNQCSAPFEVGECDAAIPVWWHDPESGECVARTYGGCGGNENRYDSQAACEDACVPSACPPNRVSVEECVMCGVAGGCSQTETACALVCSNDADCEGELGPAGVDTHCVAGACRAFSYCI